MMEQPFSGQRDIEGLVIYLGQQLDLRHYSQTDRLAVAPLTVTAGNGGVAVLFRYGVVVLFGLQPDEIARFITGLDGLISEPVEVPEQDSFAIRINPDKEEGIDQGRIRLRSPKLQCLLIVADVMAKSAVLAHYETALRAQFDRVEPLARSLRSGHIGTARGRHLLEHIGDSLMTEARMTGRIEVLEKPELIWDYPELERLYIRLEDEFELAERHVAIDRKLGLISRTAQTLLNLLHNRRSLRVEWYIVILIVIEIVLMLGEKITV
jgi:uncharacterized Rmd1/YagE family protein